LDGETGYTYLSGWPVKSYRKSRDTKGVFRLYPGADLKGKVVFKETGAPFTNQHSRMTATGGPAFVRSRPPMSIWTPIEKDGTFYIQGLSSLRNIFGVDSMELKDRARLKKDDLMWKIQFSSSDPEAQKYVMASPIAIDIQTGESKEITVELVEGSLIKGKVIDTATGKPPRDWLRVVITQPNSPFSKYCHVSHDGTWKTYLPPGEFILGYFGEAVKTKKQSSQTIKVKQGETLDCGFHRI
jgi:hypothetical protein